MKPIKLAWFCLLAAGLTVTQNAVAQEEAAKPNVVLMLADNVGWGDIGAFGGGEIRGIPTPHQQKTDAKAYYCIWI